MTERDESTGQFTSDPPLFGIEGVERDAGFIPLPDPGAATGDDELTLAEAAEALGLHGTPEGEVRSYVDGSAYDDMSYDPTENPKETVTLDRAANELEAAEARDEDAAKEAETNALRAEIDKLRGVDPEAKPEAQDAQPAKEGELEPDLERALNNPKIKDAIAAQISETEAARQSHLAGVTAATQIAQAAFMSQFPEFANIPEAQRGEALLAMQQRDPARYAQIETAVMRSTELFRQQGIAQQQEEQAKRAKFQDYARAEDARFETLIKGESKETMRAVEAEILAAVREYGGDEKAFFERYADSPFLRDATTQRMMVDAAKYRLMQKAPRAVAARSMPPVQRPGIARSRAEMDGADRQAMFRELDSAGSLNQQLKVARRILGA